MNRKNLNEKGQAIVLIALAIVGLVALTGLAIDGGNVFADRRHAQNAADTAAVSAALSKTRGNTTGWRTPGLEVAELNGYIDGGAGAEAEVIIHICNDTSDEFARGETCPPPYDTTDPEQYIHVVIKSQVDTFFAGVLGINSLGNRVEAIARSKPSQAFFEGNAVVATCSGGSKTGNTSGASGVEVNGGGLFVNSDYDDPPCAFADDGSAGSMTLTDPITVVGCADGGPAGQVIEGAEQEPPKDYSWILTALGCAGAPDDAYTVDVGTKTLTLTSSPTTITAQNFPPATVETLGPGIYCLEGNFRVVEANAVLTGTDVTFVMMGGSVTINGGTIELSAPSAGPLPNLLFYQPPEYYSGSSDNFSISGNAGADASLYLDGTILAPEALISVTGGSDTIINSQIIGCQFSLSGSSGTVINYDEENNLNEPPQIELVQ